MERQKLDFCRPILPKRRFSQISSSVPAGNSRAIQFQLETVPEWPKHEQKSVYQNSDSPSSRLVKVPAIAESIQSQEENEEEEWDTLSRNDAFLENFNISGSSSLDESDYTDRQAKDFLMQRFLRAAKAIASKIPPHYSRKMHVNHEQPKYATMVGKSARLIPAHDSRTYFETDVEEYDEEDIYDDDQRHTLAQRFLHPMSCILRQARGKSVHRATANSPKSPNADFKDVKGCTENYGRYQDIMYSIRPTPQLPLPPSDSWLNRALPSISMRNDLMQSKQQCKNNRVGSKWETMVKTSNLPYSSSVL